MSDDRAAREPEPSRDVETHRAHLLRLAYRMLGSVAEAEDAVQDGYLRWHDRSREHVDDPRAYLSRTVTRLCLDRLRQARARREVYVGPWLPEPLVEEWSTDAAPLIEQEVSTALMMALERLSPLERVAFILHDIFDMDYDDIAATLERSETACRQLASRARSNVVSARPRFQLAQDEGARLAEAFFEASRSGNATRLQALLTTGAQLHADGGGRRRAARRAIEGADRIGRFFAGMARKGFTARPIWSRRMRIDGLPGILSVEHDGTLQTTAIEPQGGRIRAIYIVRNPDKLRHLEALLPETVAERVSH
ncbi:sigma-70 family RNA polymerase sigma factor [Halomonas organivorans]|uniref:RNA polymerase sigma-70 factor (ECF subfamily) n=1 Tax=Halomonas organivorans TaxID=257772 RepID=A0A7W5BZJ9_9GAMM|nr:sigma-70 family RNA polymerase sigma factor [Halomonas organivorans]MBB3141088.1 RNA polymerase sigma-70 factor (ECF subfamily) [Halomonas organivorans]